MKSQAWSLSLLTCLLAAAGCSGKGFSEVTGTVRVDGKPLPGALVTFTPQDPTMQRGVGSTNAEGRYRVIRPGSKYGAALGVNTVRVTGGDQSRGLPERYGSGSALTFDVKRSGNVFDIDLPSK